MIKIDVYLSGKYGSTTETIEITADEIKQLACNKAKGKYEEGAYNIINADNRMEIKIESND